MANPNFKKIMLHDKQLQYPKLDQTYKWDNQKETSEPCIQTANQASWSCGFLVSSEEAAKLWKELQAHFNERKAADPSIGTFQNVFGMKKRDDGTVIFSAKRNGTKADGNLNEAPKVLDGNLNDLADKRIWSGSVGTLRVLAYPSKNPRDNTTGISLLLDTVQVTKAVYRTDDDFEKKHMEVEGQPEQPAENSVEADFKPVGETKPDPFGLPPSKQPDATGGSSEADNKATQPDFDDEIPF